MKIERLQKDETEHIKFITVVLIGFLIISQFLLLNGTVPTSSMVPTIDVGNRFFANRIAYLFDEPQRGDIVVFKHPDGGNVLLVKRVIGLPGEVVMIKNGVIYINEQPLENSFTSIKMVGTFGPYEVPEDAFFMLGDNRNNSKDSRRWEQPFVSYKLITGKAMVVYYPTLKKLN